MYKKVEAKIISLRSIKILRVSKFSSFINAFLLYTESYYLPSTSVNLVWAIQRRRRLL